MKIFSCNEQLLWISIDGSLLVLHLSSSFPHYMNLLDFMDFSELLKRAASSSFVFISSSLSEAAALHIELYCTYEIPDNKRGPSRRRCSRRGCLKSRLCEVLGDSWWAKSPSDKTWCCSYGETFSQVFLTQYLHERGCFCANFMRERSSLSALRKKDECKDEFSLAPWGEQPLMKSPLRRIPLCSEDFH